MSLATYVKTLWANRDVERPLTYTESTNGDGSITHTPSEGTIIAAGTPVNAVNMNHIEDGLVAVTEEVIAHVIDYIRNPGYALTTGSANTYIVTLSPAPSAYVDGMGIVARIHATSTGAITFNVSGLGAKAAVDSKGNAFTAAKTLLVGGRYAFRYSSAAGNFQLQGEGGGGNATAANLLDTKTATVDSGDIVGTMPNRAGDTAALASSLVGTTLKLRASNGYRDGVDDNVTITDANHIPTNIKLGVTDLGVLGTLIPFEVVAGDTLMTSADTSGVSANGATYIKYKEFKMNMAGTIRVSFSLRMSNSGNTSYGQIYKNGVAIGVARSTTSTSDVVFTEDFTVAKDDLIQLYCRGTNSGAYIAYHSNYRISLGAQSVAVATVQLDT